MTPSFLRRCILAAALWLNFAGLAMAAPPSADVATIQPQQVLVLLRMPPEHAGPGGDYGGSYGDQGGRSARRRIASGLARANGLALVDDWPMPLLGVDCFIMNVPAGRSPEAVAIRLSRDHRVASAQASHTFRAQGANAATGDPLFPTQPAAREWRLADLHEIATGRDVRIAVIDSMVDLTHPDLVGQVMLSQNFVVGRPAVAETHGTGVAGIIAARADNGLGIVGVAPRARLMALRACWQLPADRSGAAGTVCDSLSLAKALSFAIEHKAQVINLSLSGPPDPLLGLLIDTAVSRGVTVVAAYDRGAAGGGFPASHPGVIAVIDESLARPPPGVYSAPGRDVPTTQPGGRWFLVNGSSFAAAHVSGLVALVRERRPNETRGLALVANRAGGGEIDACASLLKASGLNNCACARPRAYSAVTR
jgi:hypothetical protein